MKGPTPAKSTMSSKRRLSSFCDRPEDRPVEEDVLPARQLRVEAGAELEQGGHLAVDLDGALVGAEDLGQALEHGALAGAVLADQAEGLALVDLERHVLEGPEVLGDRPGGLA